MITKNKYVYLFPIVGTNNSAYNIVEARYMSGGYFEHSEGVSDMIQGTYKEALDWLHENNLIKVN
jgi:hypothetical protein